MSEKLEATKRIHPQFFLDFEVISAIEMVIQGAFVVALHSNWEAGDVHIHHSDIIVSELLQQTKPNQLKLIIRMTGLSNVWIFQKTNIN